MELKISQLLYDQVIAHCRREAPKEACGMLGGKGNAVRRVYEMTNVDQSPISYTMDPKEQLRVMKALDAQHEELVAIYHSHTATEAYPSPVDVSLAVYPEVYYVLVSLKEPHQPIMRAFHIIDGTIAEDGVSIEV
jgi:proteasome lid subunit RPN8/RPN11